VGFGGSASAVASGPFIDLTSQPNFAFSMPRDGTITSVAAFFSTSTAQSLLATTLTVTAQLFESTAPDNSFVPVAGTNVILSPPLTGVVGIGTVSKGIVTGLNIPVTAQTRLVMVYFVNASGVFLVDTISGYAGAGVNIQ